MHKYFPLLFALLLISSAGLASCAGSDVDAIESGSVNSPTAVQATPPAEYASQTNPFGGQAAAAEDGKAIYKANCAACHGESAQGDGPAAISLDPKPQDLANTVANLSDGYLFWRISEGGAMAPFHSTMPAWKTILTPDQIWQVITYLHTLSG